MHVIADVAATLGGRFNLVFDPHAGAVYQSAIGGFREQPLGLTVGLRTPDGELWSLPFSPDVERFPFVEQSDTLTSIVYRAVHPGLWIEFCMRLRAPFYPRNVGVSAAPLYYVDLTVRRLGRLRWERCEEPLGRGEIVLSLAGEGVEFAQTEGGFAYAFQSAGPARHEAPPLGVRVESWIEAERGRPDGDCGVALAFDLDESPEARLSLVWSSWVEAPVLEVMGEPTPLKYLSLFASREEMVSWARGERERIEKRCDLLDGAVRDWSLGAAASNLAALAFHSFLANTWWTTREGGADWFSVWEGSCHYHSTVDVEYNDALLYLALWPELLGMLLDQWAEFEVDGTETLGPDGKGTGFLCHDMGADHVVGHQVYPHPMEVEENANYLLLLSAWTAFTGDLGSAAARLPLCRRLAEFIVKADTDGNGVPDRGVANTIDDASPAVQFGREQVYLAVKVQAALWALADLEQKAGAEKSSAERWRAFASKTIKTVEETAWLDDHYAVTLGRTTEGLSDPWTGEPLPEGELEGWDDYSIYTANGLLYLCLGGIKMPRWKMHRFAEDVRSAARAAMTPYGCRHSSRPGQPVWFSQNMWRDYVAAYLGVDMLNNVERYWDYQVTTGHNWRASLYYDTTEQNNLNFYPRGATVFGMPLGAAGLRLNRVDGELTLRPLRSTLSIPLLPLADWEQMRIPILTVRQREGVALVAVSERDLLEGLTLTVLDAELEPGPG